jgi:sulfur relay (sulfurtransferase) complex TusBCD TusD component (DsrE family)
MPEKSTAIIVINRYGMGQADPALGHKLLDAYLGTLYLQTDFPHSIMFYGEGVKAVCEGSPFLDALAALARKGVRIRSCSTCLNFYGLMDKLRAGEAGTMADLVKAQQEADKIITI